MSRVRVALRRDSSRFASARWQRSHTAAASSPRSCAASRAKCAVIDLAGTRWHGRLRPFQRSASSSHRASRTPCRAADEVHVPRQHRLQLRTRPTGFVILVDIHLDVDHAMPPGARANGLDDVRSRHALLDCFKCASVLQSVVGKRNVVGRLREMSPDRSVLSDVQVARSENRYVYEHEGERAIGRTLNDARLPSVTSISSTRLRHQSTFAQRR